MSGLHEARQTEFRILACMLHLSRHLVRIMSLSMSTDQSKALLLSSLWKLNSFAFVCTTRKTYRRRSRFCRFLQILFGWFHITNQGLDHGTLNPKDLFIRLVWTQVYWAQAPFTNHAWVPLTRWFQAQVMCTIHRRRESNHAKTGEWLLLLLCVCWWIANQRCA